MIAPTTPRYSVTPEAYRQTGKRRRSARRAGSARDDGRRSTVLLSLPLAALPGDGLLTRLALVRHGLLTRPARHTPVGRGLPAAEAAEPARAVGGVAADRRPGPAVAVGEGHNAPAHEAAEQAR